MILAHQAAAAAGPGSLVALALGLVAVGVFGIDDALSWIYQFLGWLTQQILSPVVAVAQAVTGGFFWAWQWISANGVYTFNFTGWVVQRAHELWDLRILPLMAGVMSAAQGFAFYFVNIADRVLVQLRNVVLGSILSILSSVGGALHITALLHAGLFAARAPFLRMADQVDLQLFALESRITDSARAVLTKVVELTSWLNLAFHPSGVFRWEAFVWSTWAWAGDLVAVLIHRHSVGDGPARFAAYVATHPTRSADEAIAQFNSGALPPAAGMPRAIAIILGGAVPPGA